jgi:UDP-2,3-diacylglucosamine pyrophosphatase LpxH
VIRSPVRIPMRKHHHWSTRLGHWIFYRYGQSQEALARLERRLGRDERAASRVAFVDYWGRGEWGDAHGLLAAADALLAEDDGVDVLVCGHSHQPGKVALSGGTYVNTGSWAFDDSTYAVCDDAGLEVRQWPDGAPIGDDAYRGVLGRRRDRPFFEWWAAYYRGWLCYDVEAMRRDCGG